MPMYSWKACCYLPLNRTKYAMCGCLTSIRIVSSSMRSCSVNGLVMFVGMVRTGPRVSDTFATPRHAHECSLLARNHESRVKHLKTCWLVQAYYCSTLARSSFNPAVSSQSVSQTVRQPYVLTLVTLQPQRFFRPRLTQHTALELRRSACQRHLNVEDCL